MTSSINNSWDHLIAVALPSINSCSVFKLSREGEGKHLAYLTDRRLVTQTKAKVVSFVGMIFRERLKKDKNKRPLIRSFFYNARRSRGDFLHLVLFFFVWFMSLQSRKSGVCTHECRTYFNNALRKASQWNWYLRVLNR